MNQQQPQCFLFSASGPVWVSVSVVVVNLQCFQISVCWCHYYHYYCDDYYYDYYSSYYYFYYYYDVYSEGELSPASSATLPITASRIRMRRRRWWKYGWNDDDGGMEKKEEGLRVIGGASENA